MTRKRIRNIIYTALFCALYVVGTMIRIPFPVVPIVLTNLFLIIGGTVLGPLWGAISVLMYLALGLTGAPVFSAGGGIAALLGPTGGYLIGYVFCSLIIGIFRNTAGTRTWALTAGGVSGLAAIYLFGLPWLKYSLGTGWIESIYMGVLPFLIGDVIKLIIALILLISIVKYNPDILMNMPEGEDAGT